VISAVPSIESPILVSARGTQIHQQGVLQLQPAQVYELMSFRWHLTPVSGANFAPCATSFKIHLLTVPFVIL
jgi:hypothetical protein